MQAHAFGQPEGNVKGLVERIGEKFEQGFIAPAQPVHIIGPVNQHTAPDHNTQHREIDPVKPADGEGMLLDDFFLCQEDRSLACDEVQGIGVVVSFKFKIYQLSILNAELSILN